MNLCRLAIRVHLVKFKESNHSNFLFSLLLLKYAMHSLFHFNVFFVLILKSFLFFFRKRLASFWRCNSILLEKQVDDVFLKANYPNLHVKVTPKEICVNTPNKRNVYETQFLILKTYNVEIGMWNVCHIRKYNISPAGHKNIFGRLVLL